MTIFPYQLVQTKEVIGTHVFQVTGLRDLDEAVSGLFTALEAKGDGEQLVELCPLFGKLWPAGRALARTLAVLGTSLEGKRVLELGCGLALPSLVAARLGADVTVSDCHPDVPEFLARNLAANDLPGVTYVRADWREPDADLGRFDLVIGSDILYDRAHPADLVRFVGRHLRGSGPVLVTDPGRAYVQEFTSRMEDAGFDADVGTDQEVFVVTFTASPTARTSPAPAASTAF